MAKAKTTKVTEAYNRKKNNLALVDETPAQELARAKSLALIEKVTQKTHKDVVQSLADLKLSLTGTVDSISNQLNAELDSLKEVQTAIASERKTLEELHGIAQEVNTLEALIQAQKEEKETFVAEMEQATAEWKEAEKTHFKNEVDFQAEVKRRRTWEEEQYKYNLTKTRRDEEDNYKDEHSRKVREFQDWQDGMRQALTAREKVIADAEGELTRLRELVAKNEEVTQKEVGRQVAIATNSLKKDLTHEHSLIKLGLENLLKLKDNEVKTLQERINELVKNNVELDTKYKEASDKVQKIAEKAIEGAQKVVFQSSVPESSNNDSRRK